MPKQFDNSLSSVDYLNLARTAVKRGKARLRSDLMWMVEAQWFDFGVNAPQLENLFNTDNWSAVVKEGSRTPRVFLGAHRNQRGSAQVYWAGRSFEPVYREDFQLMFAGPAMQQTSDGPGRPSGELMWLPGFDSLFAIAVWQRCPAATALLFGFAARLNELASQIAQRMTLVGRMTLSFSYSEGGIEKAEFVEDIE